jgi:hypothetical protein
MPRSAAGGRIDLTEVFGRVQQEMLAHLAVSKVFEHHPTTNGAATELRWIDLFNRYLPQRYRAASAFVVDSRGRRSRQIDIAIFDNLYSPLLFPHQSGLHIPAESVYAVFEVKSEASRRYIRDAVMKAASVRGLHRTSASVVSAGRRRPPIRPRPILAGILAAGSVWSPETFPSQLSAALEGQPLDLGCALAHGSFERTPRGLRISAPEESLIFLILRLLDRLRLSGTAPAADLMQYARALKSVRR